MSNRTKLTRQQRTEIAALQQETVDRRRANAEPFPGPLAAAFVGEPPERHGLKLRPVVAGDFILLRKLNSPLYRHCAVLAAHLQQIRSGQIAEGTPPPKTDYEEEEVFEMIYQFTRPVEQVRAEVNSGRAAFRELALRAIADQQNLANIPDLVAAVVANYIASFGTAIQHVPASGDGNNGEKDFPMPPAGLRTGSAGGSATSPASVTDNRSVKTS